MIFSTILDMIKHHVTGQGIQTETSICLFVCGV